MTRREYSFWWLPIIALISILCGLVVFMSGCQITPQTKERVIINFQKSVLLRIAAAEDPAEAAERVTKTATDIKEAAMSDITVSDLRGLILEVALKRIGDDRDKTRVYLLIDLVSLEIKDRTGLDLAVIPADRLIEARTLVIEVCDACISQAQPYLKR